MPGFLQSDDEDMDGVNEGPLAGVNPNRRRRQYDEVPNQDDITVDDEVGHSIFLVYWWLMAGNVT